jgi:hypothetical protein
MARITLDIFSGRPNPTWDLDDAQVADVLREIAQQRDLVGAEDAGSGKLGFRGLLLDVGDAHGGREGLPGRFRVSGEDARGVALADALLARLGAPSHTAGALPQGLAPLDQLDLRRLVHESAGDASGQGAGGSPPAEADSESTQSLSTQQAGTQQATTAAATAAATVIGSDATSWSTIAQGACSIEVAAFNPGYWNATGVITSNNCYNYATNRRTDTFAQPGRATGAQATAMKCANVSAGAVSDGAYAAPNCVPAGQEPRWYMALVIWTGVDYHWYRKQAEGYWGHKPGQTAAKNTDNSGNVIYDPQTANRGGYKTFCGYYFARAGMVIQ